MPADGLESSTIVDFRQFLPADNKLLFYPSRISSGNGSQLLLPVPLFWGMGGVHAHCTHSPSPAPLIVYSLDLHTPHTDRHSDANKKQSKRGPKDRSPRLSSHSVVVVWFRTITPVGGLLLARPDAYSTWTDTVTDTKSKATEDQRIHCLTSCSSMVSNNTSRWSKL